MFFNRVKRRDAILILLDISGYTKFMIANHRSHEVHSEVVIGELIAALIEQIKIPLKVSKLEGDAVFVYAVRDKNRAKWRNTRQLIARKLPLFFETFACELVNLSGSKLCYGNSCRGIEKLGLKIIVHQGKALLHKIAQYEELSGVDVIAAHRLLKNSVPQDNYIMLTEPFQKDITITNELKHYTGKEKYDDVGTIKYSVYLPEEQYACQMEVMV